MTTQQAIENIKEILTTHEISLKDNKEAVDALKMAAEALEQTKWIKFGSEYDEDKQMEMLTGEIPDEDEEILVTDGKTVWNDTFCRDGIECYLDSGKELVEEVVAWMHYPEPYKEEEERCK